MNSIKAGWKSCCLLALLTALACIELRLRFDRFFSGSGEPLLLILAVALTALVVGAIVGAFAPKRGPALVSALLGAPLVGGLALLDVPVVSKGTIALCAAVAFVLLWIVAARLKMERKGVGMATLVVVLAAIVLPGVQLKPAATPVTASAAGTTGGAATPVARHPKLFVFGLDAGTWTILNEQFEKEQLPNLRRLRDEGSSAVLRSEVESASPRVWTSIATGKTPAKHGVVDFFSTQNESLKARRIWEILAHEGWSVGLFQWLVTWPPDPFDPFVVPAWMARGRETRPAELGFIKDLELAFQTGEFDDWVSKGDWSTALTKVRDWGLGYLRHGLRMKTVLGAVSQLSGLRSERWELAYAAKRTLQLLLNGDVYLELYRRGQPDFSCFICYGTDNLAHKLWQYHFPDDFGIPHEKAAPFADLLVDYYKRADALLGEILPLLPAETTVAVLSDHGFTSVGEGGNSAQRELRPRMIELADRMHLTKQDVLWSAVATRGYFRLVAHEGNGSELAARMMKFLEGCEAVGGPKVFVPKVTDTGQIEVAVNLDATFERDTPVATPAGAMKFSDLVDIEDRAGNHSVDGILILRGAPFRRGARLDAARLVDIAPTLLHSEGLAIGADMDGQVLVEALTEAFRSEHDVERIESWDSQVEVTRDATIKGDDTGALKYMEQLGYTGGGSKSAAPATGAGGGK